MGFCFSYLSIRW